MIFLTKHFAGNSPLSRRALWPPALVILLLAFGAGPLTFGQGRAPVSETSPLAERLAEESARRRAEVEAYARENDIPMTLYLGDGQRAYLHDIEPSGLPTYRKSFSNVNAARTTGAYDLFEGQSTGFDLSGDGYEIGIWEAGGVVLASHVEFGGRVVNQESDGVSDHATHVAGTMVAAGVRTDSRGMADKARLLSYNSQDDNAEMASEAADGMLLSNHSYGLVAGWDGGVWTGEEEDLQEDRRFGRYNSNAATWDGIAFGNPYYLIVKSAGNDRGDSGSGRPPDGDYDCISGAGTAKNILTVGAVFAVTNYTSPNSVNMSSFSGWGPVDDGRIKPDIVANGVGLVSSVAGASGVNNAYAAQSGTSMSAPNATGSLLLVQELHQKLYGEFMLSATLKGLAIHSAKEAGAANGPDYSFGWGLLDVRAMSEAIARQDGETVRIEENTLAENDSYVFEIESDGSAPLVATICWTDPAGNPGPYVVDDPGLKLVNDLDLRIFGPDGAEYEPWILNPGSPASNATRGDNFRDNVEKVEVLFPAAGVYTVQVTHKGSALRNGMQNYSIIATSSDYKEEYQTYYWVGGDGDWNDGANWSLSSGGDPANVVPTASDVVRFDNNSFSSGSQAASLSADATCHRLVWSAGQNPAIDLGSHTLTVTGALRSSSSTFTVSGDGTLLLDGSVSPKSFMDVIRLDAGSATVRFEGASVSATLSATGELVAGALQIAQGHFSGEALDLSVGSLLVERSGEGGSFTLDAESSVSVSDEVSLFADGQMPIDIASVELFRVEGASATVDADGVSFGAFDSQADTLTLSGSMTFEAAAFAGSAYLSGSNIFASLALNGDGSILELEAGTVQTVGGALTAAGTAAAPIRVVSSDASSTAQIIGTDPETKNCYEAMIVDGVDVGGSALFILEGSSSLVSGEGWITDQGCEDVLFAEFVAAFACEDATTEFSDLSSGSPASWLWNFGDPNSTENTSTEQNPLHIYEESGFYTVTLTVTGTGGEQHVQTEEIEVLEGGGISIPRIVEESGTLIVSPLQDGVYQWYLDGEPIAGAASVDYVPTETGDYQVELQNDNCKFRSQPFFFAVEATGLFGGSEDESLRVYPNPSASAFAFSFESGENGRVEYALYDLTGRRLRYGADEKRGRSFESHIERGELTEGVYLLRVTFGGRALVRKVVFE